jgi:hypothetical protein
MQLFQTDLEVISPKIKLISEHFKILLVIILCGHHSMFTFSYKTVFYSIKMPIDKHLPKEVTLWEEKTSDKFILSSIFVKNLENPQNCSFSNQIGSNEITN